jgi:N-acetyl-gamma-glutamyl-phosphate reductase, common form
MQKNVKAGVIGATGYAGAELCRLLLNHPNVTLSAISSVSFEGKAISDVYPAYKAVSDMICESQDEVVQKSDVIFAALPHGLSQKLAAECDEKGKIFIDLGADFRLKNEDKYKEWYNGEFENNKLHEKAVYGLPELFREEIQGKTLVANPGCYTTAVPLALGPAIKNGFIEFSGIVADCKSGVTGAGRQPTQGTHYPELNENFYAYKIASHRHTPEIEQTLSVISDAAVKVTFIPHLLPISRGILATCYAKLKEGVTCDMVEKVYQEQYANEYFVRLLPQGQSPQIKNVRYTNYCDISVTVDERTDTLVAISVIDNMVKGAAGQAIQNMNLCLGLDETDGLRLIPPAF